MSVSLTNYFSPGLENTVRLMDGPCFKKLPFACKRYQYSLTFQIGQNWRHYLPDNYFLNLPSTCPEVFIDILTKCVKFHDDVKQTQRDANNYCYDDHGNRSTLPSFHSNSELLEISLHLKSIENQYWIGLMTFGDTPFLVDGQFSGS